LLWLYCRKTFEPSAQIVGEHKRAVPTLNGAKFTAPDFFIDNRPTDASGSACFCYRVGKLFVHRLATSQPG
jgi:hypothetical protein